MAFKSFLAPTGSGHTIFESDVINGYFTADRGSVVLKFYSNDRGYSCASFGRTSDSGVPFDPAGVRALRDELAALLNSAGETAGSFEACSAQGHFTLRREMEGAALILGIHGTDPKFGAAYHRGDLGALKKIIEEFEPLLKALETVPAVKA